MVRRGRRRGRKKEGGRRERRTKKMKRGGRREEGRRGKEVKVKSEFVHQRFLILNVCVLPTHSNPHQTKIPEV